MRRSRSRLRALAHATLVTVLAGSAFAAGAGASATASTGATGSSAPTGTAAPAYKYWGYYHDAGDDWEFSTKGAHEYIPDNGSVEGWRYGLDTSGNRPPRTLPDFDAICGDEAASGGQKLVAVVIDYGIPEEAEGDDVTPPARGACASVPDGASGQQVLQSVADTSTGDAGIASIDGYPSVPTTKVFDSSAIPADEPPVELELAAETDGAADTADTADPTADTGDEDEGAPWGLIAVGAVAVVLIGGAVVVARRRS